MSGQPPTPPLDALGFFPDSLLPETPSPAPTALDAAHSMSPDPAFDAKDNPFADSFKSASLGGVGDELHDAIVRSVVEQEAYYRQLLAPSFQRIVKWWRLYFSQKDDRRGEGEQWRANVVVPYAYSGVRTMISAVSDIINSADPPIQAQAVSADGEEAAKAVQRLLNYTLRKNQWELTLDKGLADCGVQGIWLPKLVHQRRAQKVMVIPNSQDAEDWRKAVADCEMGTGQKAPGEPHTFEAWRGMMNGTGKWKIPEMPIPRWEEVVEYDGPQIVHDSLFQYRYDPFVDDIQQHDVVIQRVVKTRQWLEAHTGDSPDKPFDPRQVKQALAGYEYRRFSEWQDQIANMLSLGLGAGAGQDPRYQDAMELWEVWRKDAQHPYLVILNRKAIINKPDSQKCYSNPFWHGQYPYFPVRNVPVQGYFHGISEIQPNEPLYHEMNTMRDLRLDAITLRVLGVFMRQNDAGIPELSRLLQPGMVLPTSRPDGIRNLFEGDMAGVMAAFREIDYIKQDIDETNSTPSSVRGGASTVGRVSATETERRFSQALARHKQRDLVIENELQPFVRQALFLWYQFHNSGERIRVGGKDPFVTIKKSQFAEALDMDFRFVGASKALNRDTTSQALMNFYKMFGQALTLPETRALARRTYETVGQPGVETVVSEEGTQQLVAQQQAQQQAAAAQAAGAQAPGGGQAPAGAPAPAAGQPPSDPNAAPTAVEGPEAEALIAQMSAAGGGGQPSA